MARYNLRSTNAMLKDLVPPNYMSKKLELIGEDSDSDYISDSDDNSGGSPINVNITFTINGEEVSDEDYTDDSDSEDDCEDDCEDEEESEDKTAENKLTDEFLDTVQSMGSKLSEFKDLPMYKKLMNVHKTLRASQTAKKKKQELPERNTNKTVFNKLLANKPLSDMQYFIGADLPTQRSLIASISAVRDINVPTKPLRIQLLESNIPQEYKLIALQKISQLGKSGDGENGKRMAWLDGFMRIPFGIYCNLPATIKDGPEICHEFISNAKQCLDDCTYGLVDAKIQIIQYIGQLLANPAGVGTSLAIEGPMGTGKTTLIKEGVSKILKRPFAFISLGGAQDSSILDGHMITYEGSIWGQIADILMTSKCMNPVIYFDELDKVSETPRGEELIGVLTHLTDSTQNTQFKDNYFAGIDLDLSRATLVFSYNNSTNVNSILRDRMNVIKTTGYSIAEKVVIAREYLSKSIRKNISFDDESVIIPDATLTYIIDKYTGNEKGVRNLKRCLETIHAKLNLFRLMVPGKNIFIKDIAIIVTFPFTVTIESVGKLLKVSDDSKISEMMMYV